MRGERQTRHRDTEVTEERRYMRRISFVPFVSVWLIAAADEENRVVES